jgi:hypothetical protein
MAKVDIYRGRDPRDVPTYSIREAASYMRLPSTTLREWVSGPARVIQLAGGRPPLLSFWNLVEAYVLAALRRRHRVPLQRVRKALRFPRARARYRAAADRAGVPDRRPRSLR